MRPCDLIFAGYALTMMCACSVWAGEDASAPMVRGVVRAVNQAQLSIDLPVRVEKLNVREAQSFKKGDVLVAFDCERADAEYRAAAAVSREMKLTLESQAYLDSKGAAGKLDVQIALARAAKAEAEAAAIAARLKQCRLVAPYDGRVTELKINEQEMPQAGQSFMAIVDETSFEIDLIVPSRSLRELPEGRPFTFAIDDTGRSYEARVLRIGAAIDPVSQSVKVIAGFKDRDDRVLVGMSGTAKFPMQQAAQ